MIMWLFILSLIVASFLAFWPRRKLQSIPSSIKEPVTLLTPDEVEELALKRAREKLEQEEREKQEKAQLEEQQRKEQERKNENEANKLLAKIAKNLLEEGTSQGCEIFEDDRTPSKEVKEILEFKLNRKGWESTLDERRFGYYLTVVPLKELKDCSMSSYR